MPTKLSTTVAKIPSIANETNSQLVAQYHGYMKQNGASERHQNNQLKAAIAYATFLGPTKTFLDVRSKEQILEFLDTKIKTEQQDPEKKWITTWNDACHRIKRLYRWLYNSKKRKLTEADWKTPSFAQIREKKTKRLSPYSETEI